MKTYFVRTIADQTLVGIFCAASPRMLGKLIEEMAEPLDCEYLPLQVNEGLFLEAPFVTAPDGTVFLTNTPEEYAQVDESGSSEAAAMPLAPPGSALEHAMSEVIPPVLEPTADLQRRLQGAQRGGWIKFSTKEVEKSKAAAPRTATPILLLGGARIVH